MLLCINVYIHRLMGRGDEEKRKMVVDLETKGGAELDNRESSLYKLD